MGKDKTIDSGDKRYDVSDTLSGDRRVATPTWVPGGDKTVGTGKTDKDALDIIKSDSGSDKTEER